MSPDQLRRFRKERRLSQAVLAGRLGIGVRTLGQYETGQRPIPLTVALACSALAMNLPPYGEQPHAQH